MIKCNSCRKPEERLFTDTWTGTSLCLACLGPIWYRITNSPSSEGDNLDQLLTGEEENNHG
jgi:hypothetical protein